MWDMENNLRITNHENKLHRHERLLKARRLAAFQMGLSVSQLDRLIHEIKDDKGDLLVFWWDKPTEKCKDAWGIAWHLCGEYECNVRHSVEGPI